MTPRSLLVDDNSRFLSAARELLEREGLEVVGVASTVAEATRLVGALDPDVCLVDIDLGSESGFELARQIATGENHSPHVILISAYPGRDFTDMIAESPAIGFLSKPELSAARVRAIVAGHESGESQPG